MKSMGTSAYGIKLPIIGRGDNLPRITAESVIRAAEEEGLLLTDSDVIGVTEAIVAKAQGNYASCDDIANDIRRKFPEGELAVVFPIMSRNRFLNILKGIAKGADKVSVILSFPADEVGNPIMDLNRFYDLEDRLKPGFFTAKEFREITGAHKHPFTGEDYIALYESLDNVEVYVANDPRHALKITGQILASEIHTRFATKKRLLSAGAKTVYTLSDILNEAADGMGYNPDYGVLGSNISTGDTLKLFPRDCDKFIRDTRELFQILAGVEPEILVYGDGAFKDPVYGIWELADPVVSPGYTDKLNNKPDEIKLKHIADDSFGHLGADEKAAAIYEMIKAKKDAPPSAREGTTPRKYHDLLGSLCDLISGSGDKGTPVVLIKNYFDNYASE